VALIQNAGENLFFDASHKNNAYAQLYCS